MRALPVAAAVFACVACVAAAAGRPCDVYDAAGAPCVAAHSTVRALYAAYSGALYAVRRASDNAVANVTTLAAGSAANATEQDVFCAGTDCQVVVIYDQSPKGNHLATAPGGGAAPKPDAGVNATRAPLHVGGARVYGAYFEGGMGYRNDNTVGVATGTEPQTVYMVVNGRVYNSRCCFDYGNAETNALDDGKGAMEAVYWGTSSGWGHGAGSGPWVMADLENGLWAGNDTVNPGNKPIVADYVLAMVKGRPGAFTLKGGDVQGGNLATLYDGVRPDGYTPMRKQGAIILGIGGDNSDWAIGQAHEMVMTAGYSTDAADAAVFADVVAAGYKDVP